MELRKNYMRLAAMIFFVMCMALGTGTVLGANSPALDDMQKHWAKTAVDEFHGKGYISGYEDNTFRPDNFVTRAEFVNMINKIMGFKGKQELNFKDVKKTDWYYEQLAIAMKSGYINGYSDQTFRADAPITRAEASVMLTRAINLDVEKAQTMDFNFNSPDWAKKSVALLYQAKILQGYEGDLRLNDRITRAESVVLIDRIKKSEHQLIKSISQDVKQEKQEKKEEIKQETPAEAGSSGGGGTASVPAPKPPASAESSQPGAQEPSTPPDSGVQEPNTPQLPPQSGDQGQEPSTPPSDPGDQGQNPPPPSQPGGETPTPPQTPQEPQPPSPAPESGDDKLATLIEKLKRGKNKNVVSYETNGANGKEKRAIIWVNGITAPDISDFTADTSVPNYLIYSVTSDKGAGWFDVNKAKDESPQSQVDRNMCYAAVSANQLHWWLEQNKADVARYILEKERNGYKFEKPNTSKYLNLKTFIDSYKGQDSSELFNMFKIYFGRADTGYYPDLLNDLFINGCKPPVHGGTNDPEWKFESDSRGGFFYDVFGKKLLTGRMGLGSYDSFQQLVTDLMKKGDMIGITHNVAGGIYHIVTVWGVEYDLSGNIVGLYISDSDDQYEPEKAMRKVFVNNREGYPVITTKIGDKKAGSRLWEICTLSLGTEYWGKYFNVQANQN